VGASLGVVVGSPYVGAFDGRPVEGDRVGVAVVGASLGVAVGSPDVGAFDGRPVEGD